MDGTSFALWTILALEVLGLVWMMILVRISSTRIEARIQNLKNELAQWVIDEAAQLDISQEAPTPYQMAMPFIQDWLEGVVSPSVEAKLIPPRSEGGTFRKID